MCGGLRGLALQPQHVVDLALFVVCCGLGAGNLVKIYDVGLDFLDFLLDLFIHRFLCLLGLLGLSAV